MHTNDSESFSAHHRVVGQDRLWIRVGVFLLLYALFALTQN